MPDPDDAELGRRHQEALRKVAFTLPPSPDEVQSARERADEHSRQVAQHATMAWRQVPRGMQASETALLDRCEHRLRKSIELRPNLSALILGPTGVGKTSAAAYLVRRALGEYRNSLGERFPAAAGLAWIYAPDLINADKKYQLGAGDAPIVVQALNASALVLDEVMASCCNQILFDILSKRYQQGDRPVIVTTGLTHTELTTHLSAAGVRKITHQPAPGPVLCINLHESGADKASAKR